MSMLSKATGIHIKVPGTAIAGLVPGGGLLGAVANAFGASKNGVSKANLPGYPGVDWKNPLRGIPGFGSALGFAGGDKKGRIQPGENGACPKGYHLNKAKLSDGTDPGTVCVRNRHMNPANGRAIGRAVRRIKAGERQYRHVFSIMHHKAAGKILPRRKHK